MNTDDELYLLKILGIEKHSGHEITINRISNEYCDFLIFTKAKEITINKDKYLTITRIVKHDDDIISIAGYFNCPKKLDNDDSYKIKVQRYWEKNSINS